MYRIFQKSFYRQRILETLRRARAQAISEGLRYVYVGNVHDRDGDATYCPGCGATVIARDWSGPRSGSDWLRCDPRHVGRAWRDASFRRAACALVPPGRFHLVQSHERLSCCDVYRAGDGVHAQWLANRSRAGSAWMRVATALSPYHRQLLAAERRMFTSPRLRAVICNSRMVREEIQLKNVTYADLLKGGIGYIRLERFSNNTGDEVARILELLALFAAHTPESLPMRPAIDIIHG